MHPGVQAIYAARERAFRPRERVGSGDWPERFRVISPDSPSPHPGPWKDYRAPYLREVLACMDDAHPAQDVVVMKSAQTGFTEMAINAVMWAIDQSPSSMLYILHGIDPAKKFSAKKLDPAIAATARVSALVTAELSKKTRGSTALRKRFPGGFLEILSANAASNLQMETAKRVFFDEVSQYPDEAGGRGDPVEQGLKRTLAFRRAGAKHLFFSTPAEVGRCRIHTRFLESDQRRYYMPCPHCAGYMLLRPQDIAWRAARSPHGAHVDCRQCGAEIDGAQQDYMIDRGVWITTYDDCDAADPPPPLDFPEGDLPKWRERASPDRQPGFHLWQAMSKFAPWDTIVADVIAAEGDPQSLKTLTQQVYGEPYASSDDAPDWRTLLAINPNRPRSAVPREALVLTGFVDVQGDRLEWGVYGWGPGNSGAPTPWLIDWGVCPGDTSQDDVWAALDEVRARQYPDAAGTMIPVTLWGVDSGYRTPMVYRYAQTREAVVATNGLAGQGGVAAQLQPMVSTPKVVEYDFRGQKISGAMRYNLGVWSLKAWLYDALRLCLQGPKDGKPRPGAWRGCEGLDQEFFEQLTAETLRETVGRDGRVSRKWAPVRARNEQLDIACGNRAMAQLLSLHHMDAAAWEALRMERGAPAFSDDAPKAAPPDRSISDAPKAAPTPAKPWIPRPRRWI